MSCGVWIGMQVDAVRRLGVAWRGGLTWAVSYSYFISHYSFYTLMNADGECGLWSIERGSPVSWSCRVWVGGKLGLSSGDRREGPDVGCGV